MPIGVLTVKLAIREAMSLKDKRSVVKSLKDRIHNSFNASVAEIDNLDKRQSATIAIAIVANEQQFLKTTLSKVADFIRYQGRAELVDYEMELF